LLIAQEGNHIFNKNKKKMSLLIAQKKEITSSINLIAQKKEITCS